ncbi:MAG: iron-containing redox enzyme family protein, partial [Patulibacter sp.]|nr:iron-containing redox enzyme family protein [Patulibacter sp.]
MPTCPLPQPRGPVTEELIAALQRSPATAHRRLHPPSLDGLGPDPAGDDDLQLALYLCYELHYRGIEGVADAWEWDPTLLSVRCVLERAFELAVRQLVVATPEADPQGMDLALAELIRGDDAPAVSSFVERKATVDQLRELIVHRSAYQLKEADPHSFALPRLWGRPKAAMVEIQVDEYGGGKPDRIHADLYATMMRELDLDGDYGAYVDLLPGTTLATVNLASMFGLHRRLRGACAGHLALTEMTSSVPSRRYAAGLRRLGYASVQATDFYDEHVEADAVHESIAAVDLAGGLAQQDLALGRDAIFGAAALLALEGRFARRVLGAWEADESSLLRALPPAR